MLVILIINHGCSYLRDVLVLQKLQKGKEEEKKKRKEARKEGKKEKKRRGEKRQEKRHITCNSLLYFHMWLHSGSPGAFPSKAHIHSHQLSTEDPAVMSRTKSGATDTQVPRYTDVSGGLYSYDILKDLYMRGKTVFTQARYDHTNSNANIQLSFLLNSDLAYRSQRALGKSKTIVQEESFH